MNFEWICLAKNCLVFLICFINLSYLWIYSLSTSLYYFIDGLVIILFFHLILDHAWVVEIIDYDDIFQKPCRKTVYLPLQLGIFAFVFTFLFEFSFFLFCYNTIMVIIAFFTSLFYSTFLQTLCSILLGICISIPVFYLYKKKIQQC